MTFDTQTLYDLLPAFLRKRDVEVGAGVRARSRTDSDLSAEDFGPLRNLISVIADQVGIVERDIEQLYADLFIETCAEWVVPYHGALVGANLDQDVVGTQLSGRAQVANTIARRRRKGTIAAITSIARDSTNWPVSAIELFQRLGWTQNLNHLRRNHRVTVDVRRSLRLEQLGTPFDVQPRSVDVRSIHGGRVRPNIPNIGVFLWRVQSRRHHRATPLRVGGSQRFTVSPLGRDMPLYQKRIAKDRPFDRTLPENVPLPITRLALAADLTRYYGVGRSLCIWVGGVALRPDEVTTCNLSSVDPTQPVDTVPWQAGHPPNKTRIDPELGRFILADGLDPLDVRVLYHYGALSDAGGGEYDRSDTATGADPGDPSVGLTPAASIAAALSVLGGRGDLLISSSATIAENFELVPNAGAKLRVRAADGTWPTLDVSGDLDLHAAPDSTTVLDGLRIVGGALHIHKIDDAQSAAVVLRDCTFVPGQRLHRDGTPLVPDGPSIVVHAPGIRLRFERSICGGIQVEDDTALDLFDSAVDAGDGSKLAIGRVVEEPPGSGTVVEKPGGVLCAQDTTFVGRVLAMKISTVTNSVFASLPQDGSTEPALLVARPQTGCFRYSYLPWEAVVPRRYRCAPAAASDAVRVRPLFASSRYGDAAYLQLAPVTAVEIRQGADNGAEMGLHHDLNQRARESNLRASLDEYVRFGMEAGLIYAS